VAPWLRGFSLPGALVLLDERIRHRLKIKAGETYDFELSKTDYCGQVSWALEASDIRHSFAARLALVSVVLGLVGLLIAVFSSAVQLHFFR
jgi:hypothetical protein